MFLQIRKSIPVQFNLTPSAIKPLKQPLSHHPVEAFQTPSIKGNPVIVIVSAQLDVE